MARWDDGNHDSNINNAHIDRFTTASTQCGAQAFACQLHPMQQYCLLSILAMHELVRVTVLLLLVITVIMSSTTATCLF